MLLSVLMIPHSSFTPSWLFKQSTTTATFLTHYSSLHPCIYRTVCRTTTFLFRQGPFMLEDTSPFICEESLTAIIRLSRDGHLQYFYLLTFSMGPLCPADGAIPHTSPLCELSKPINNFGWQFPFFLSTQSSKELGLRYIWTRLIIFHQLISCAKVFAGIWICIFREFITRSHYQCE